MTTKRLNRKDMIFIKEYIFLYYKEAVGNKTAVLYIDLTQGKVTVKCVKSIFSEESKK